MVGQVLFCLCVYTFGTQIRWHLTLSTYTRLHTAPRTPLAAPAPPPAMKITCARSGVLLCLAVALLERASALQLDLPPGARKVCVCVARARLLF